MIGKGEKSTTAKKQETRKNLINDRKKKKQDIATFLTVRTLFNHKTLNRGKK